MGRDVLRLGWSCIQFQRLGLGGEIPRFALGQSRD